MHKTLGFAAAVLLAGLAPAAAHATTFSGSCQDIAGTATFAKPLKQAQEANHYDFSGKATCTGTVNGMKLPDGSAVHIHVAGDGNLGCVQGAGNDGKGTITLDATGQVVGFLMDFTSTASEVDIKLRGAKGGAGTGSASFFNQSDPMANLTTLQNCGGDGNKSLAFTAKANVPDSTPLDDGQQQPQPQPSSSSSSGDSSSTSGSSQNEQPASNPQQPASQQPASSQPSQPQSKSKPKKKNKKAKKHPKKSKKKGKGKKKSPKKGKKRH